MWNADSQANLGLGVGRLSFGLGEFAVGSMGRLL